MQGNMREEIMETKGGRVCDSVCDGESVSECVRRRQRQGMWGRESV